MPWERGRLAPDVLHQLCDGAHVALPLPDRAAHWLAGAAYGEETPPRPYGPPLLRALATLVEGGVRMTWLLCGCQEFRSCDGLLF